jgi:hypothetical protein
MTYADTAAVLADFNDYTASADEITAWNTITAYADADLVVTKAGLFGADLTAFNDACTAAADVAICDPADYADYTGWAIGVSWTPDQTTPPATGDKRGVAFNTLMQYIQVTFISTASTAYTLESGSLKKAATAIAPAATTDVAVAAAIDAFTAWGGAGVTDATMKKAQFAYYFQDSTATTYFEAGSTEDIWITEGCTAAGANVETSAFVFVGAVNLTVAATSAIIASLLF